MSGHRDDGTYADNKAHHPSRKVGREHVGTYMGSVGRTHMFSAENTGGDSTDSMQAYDTGGGSWGGIVGNQYHVPTSDVRHIRPVEDPENGLVWNKNK